MSITNLKNIDNLRRYSIRKSLVEDKKTLVKSLLDELIAKIKQKFLKAIHRIGT